jgi:hypothetical protein
VKPHARAPAASKADASPERGPRIIGRIPRGADLPAVTTPVRADLRLASFRVLFPQTLQRLTDELSRLGDQVALRWPPMHRPIFTGALLGVRHDRHTGHW